MLDSIIELIPPLKNALLHDREKRIVAAVILISVSITVFVISLNVAYQILEVETEEEDEPEEQTTVKTYEPRTLKYYDEIEKEALYFSLGRAFKNNNLTYAEDIVDKLIANDSTDSFAQYFSAKINIERKNYNEAYLTLLGLKLRNFMPDSVKTLLISVVSDEELQDIIKDPDSLSAIQLAKAGERFVAMKNDSLAHVLFTKSLRKDSNSVEALYQSARWYMNRKNYKTAEKLLNKLLLLDSLSARTQGRYAILLHETGRYRQPLAHYKIAFARDSFDFNLAYNFGDLYFSYLNDNENAKKYFKRAVELEPSTWQSYFKLGVISLESNTLDSAIYYFEIADDYSTDNLRLLYLLATAYEKKNDYESALEVYERLLKIDPLNDIALYKKQLLKSK